MITYFNVRIGVPKCCLVQYKNMGFDFTHVPVSGVLHLVCTTIFCSTGLLRSLIPYLLHNIPTCERLLLTACPLPRPLPECSSHVLQIQECIKHLNSQQHFWEKLV